MKKLCLVLLPFIFVFLFLSPTLIFTQHEECPAAGYEDCGLRTCDDLVSQVRQYCCPSCGAPKQCYDDPACPGYSDECPPLSNCSAPDCPGENCPVMECIDHQCVSDCGPCEDEDGVTPTPTPTPTPTAKTCSLSLSSPSVNYPDSVRVDFSGNTYSAGGETVRLWVERQDSGQITPSPGSEGYYGGKYYYNIGQCTSSNYTQCSTFVNVSLPAGNPAGNYYFHCDIATDPGKCSGNPFCPYEGCTSNCADCTGWVSCSASDNRAFTVIGVPTCTISGSTTIVLGNPGSWSATATVLGGGDANVEIDRNTSQSVTGLNQIAYSDCSSTANNCAVVGNWTPTATGTYYVFCRGYNNALRECRPFGPYVYPADVDCGSNDWLTVEVVSPADAWFQTKDGDVHAQTTITDPIPDTAPEPYCSLVGDGGYPGVVSYGGTNADFSPGGSASARGWLANSSYGGITITYGYDYFYSLVGSPTSTPHDGAINQNEIRQDLDNSGNNIVVYDGDVATDAEWNLQSRKAVILINGRFLLKNRIRSEVGGSVVIVAENGIGVSKNLGATGEGGNIIRAIFITDGMFYSSVDPSAFPASFTTASSDKKLVIDGSVIAWGGVNFTGRDFSVSSDPAEQIRNNTEPVEFYRYDPALFIDSNKNLWKPTFTWQELAP